MERKEFLKKTAVAAIAFSSIPVAGECTANKPHDGLKELQRLSKLYDESTKDVDWNDIWIIVEGEHIGKLIEGKYIRGDI